MRPYKNSDSKLKHIVRGKLLEHCIDIGLPEKGPISIFSFPAENFIWEQMAIELYDNPKITCIEKDKKLYDSIVLSRSNMPEVKDITYLHGHDSEILKDLSHKYHIIWLDYCSCVSHTLISNLIPIVQGRNSSFTDKGKALISMTLSVGHEIDIKDLVELTKSKDNMDYRLNGFPDQLKYHAKCNNKDLTLIKTFTYKDTERNPKATTMITYIFELTNEPNLRIDQL